jgi:hypothetical protein
MLQAFHFKCKKELKEILKKKTFLKPEITDKSKWSMQNNNLSSQFYGHPVFSLESFLFYLKECVRVCVSACVRMFTAFLE